jgi:ribonuclease P protein component
MLKLQLLPQYDIVVVGRKSACRLSGQQAKESLHKLFRRASILTIKETGL